MGSLRCLNVLFILDAICTGILVVSLVVDGLVGGLVLVFVACGFGLVVVVGGVLVGVFDLVDCWL